MKYNLAPDSSLGIIAQTPRGFGSHFATSRAKYLLSSWLLSCTYNYLTYEELGYIKNGSMSFQFLIDLATIIHYSRGNDPYKDITS